MKHSELASSYFKEGYNCAQSLVKAYADVMPYDEEMMVKLASGFGGGIGRCRLTCGAFSGIIFVIDAIYGYSTSDDYEKKVELYNRIQILYASFIKRFETSSCKALLSITDDTLSPIPTKRDENFYQTRPCENLIIGACDILDDYLQSI